MASIINASTSGVGGVITTADNSGDLNIQSGGSTKIAVTSAGVVVTGLSKGSLPTGSVLQVVSATGTSSTSTSSTSWTSTGVTATITPSSASSKVIVIATLPTRTNMTGGNGGAFTIFRGTVAGTNLGTSTLGLGLMSFSAAAQTPYTFTITDSPATASAQTYTIGMKSQGGGNTIYISDNFETWTITLIEVAA